MLTKEILLANEALAGLTEEQVTAITTLSTNDENSVIAKKTGEIYGSLDADILAASGVEKNGTEKTYDYAKRVLGDFKTKADNANGLQTQVDDLTKEKTRLEGVIAKGSNDTETAKALQQAKADLANITTQYNDLNTKYQTAQEEHKTALFKQMVGTSLDVASAGLKFKTGLPENVTRVIVDQAKEKIMAMNSEMIDDGKGGKILAFKDENGAIMRNANNKLEPFTTAEMLQNELTKMGILETARQQNGAGTTQQQTGGGNGVIDVSGAKTQTEAYDIISKALMANGITITSKDFETEMTKAWNDYNIHALPKR